MNIECIVHFNNKHYNHSYIYHKYDMIKKNCIETCSDTYIHGGTKKLNVCVFNFIINDSDYKNAILMIHILTSW